MKIKKLTALLLSLLLILGSVPVAHAAGGLRVSIQASEKNVAPGDTVTFDIWVRGIDSSVGIMGVAMYLSVSDGLSVVSIEPLNVPSGWIYRTMSSPLAYGCGGYTVYYGGDMAVGRLTCTVDEDASGQLRVSMYDEVVADGNMKRADFTSSNASVTVIRHECAANGDWKQDENDHWHECECGEVLDKAAHTYSDWSVETPATCTESGRKVRNCTVCGRREENEIPAGHTDADGNRICDACGENLCAEHEYEQIVTREATCIEPGEMVYKCKQCGSIERSEEIPALEHNWEIQSETEEMTVWTCTRCGETREEKKESAGDDAVQGDAPDDGDIEITEQPDGSMVINTGSEAPVPVEIPVEGVKPGHVVAVVNEDGTETIVSDTKMTESGLVFSCVDGATVKVVNNAKSFADIKGGNWYNNAVDYVTARGIMNGMGDDTFSPGSTTTRAQVWTMLARLAGVDTTSTEGSWYDAARAWIVETAISDGARADDSITRQELVTMLYRFAQFQGKAEGEIKSIESFSDAAQVSGWAKAAVEWAYGMGVMNGNADGTLDPTGNTTRAEMAQFFTNFIQNI